MIPTSRISPLSALTLLLLAPHSPASATVFLDSSTATPACLVEAALAPGAFVIAHYRTEVFDVEKSAWRVYSGDDGDSVRVTVEEVLASTEADADDDAAEAEADAAIVLGVSRRGPLSGHISFTAASNAPITHRLCFEFIKAESRGWTDMVFSATTVHAPTRFALDLITLADASTLPTAASEAMDAVASDLHWRMHDVAARVADIKRTQQLMRDADQARVLVQAAGHDVWGWVWTAIQAVAMGVSCVMAVQSSRAGGRDATMAGGANKTH